MKPEAVHEAINLAKTNNQKAFGYLFESFWDYLYNYLLKKIGNEDQAEDIAVRTFAKAFDKIHTFNPSFKFETWLTTISKNIQIDQHRKQNSKN
ncbi:MAG: RNA polymerase sigma factor, partial [Flavobacteriaceae bacterium]